MIVLDAHCDAPSQMLRLRDYGKDNSHAQVDFPKMRRGGVDASFFALYVPAYMQGEQATEYAWRLLDEVDRQVSGNSDIVAYARCASSVLRNRSDGRLSVILGIENASAIGESFELLKEFYKRGVRYITLTHSADNQVGDSCTGVHTWGGLSPFGRELIPEMNRRRMMIDLAHSSDDTMRDVLSLSSKPVAYTHGCCRALASHKRNISDEMIRAIADGGGVVCMSIYPCFLDDDFVGVLERSSLEQKMWVEDEFIKSPSDPDKIKAWNALQDELSSLPRPGVQRVVDHIEHAVNVAGIEHVGIGTDYDGIEVCPAGLEDISHFPMIWEEMRKRGFGKREISMIAGDNFLRVMRDNRR